MNTRTASSLLFLSSFFQPDEIFIPDFIAIDVQSPRSSDLRVQMYKSSEFWYEFQKKCKASHCVYLLRLYYIHLINSTGVLMNYWDFTQQTSSVNLISSVIKIQV